MRSINQSDFTGGLVLTLLGAATTGYAWIELPIGTVRQMGPGFFPAAIGLLLFFIGVFIALGALKSSDRLPTFELRSALAVIAGLAGFALTIDRFGLVPAIFVLTLLSSFASQKLNWRVSLLISVILCVLAWAIFLQGFNMPIRLWRWPF
ncbi:tripartite tricarboxylate transporter TctB family protein [Natronospirillum operosum]|uniref:Tripartite tricarboxylate transporter TctB family protein n=1 Tax=Natronospirillum operosum TaxID=2759953 RepID=A0A4Z0W9E9_9GAMM|nr:tripartite tricarboxylate transporter TctB family protein [Natronospirillum operosum]TGG93599.1 tripartite tricarboxylate transporter TctB family protein [Natronospirillum operosum]